MFSGFRFYAAFEAKAGVLKAAELQKPCSKRPKKSKAEGLKSTFALKNIKNHCMCFSKVNKTENESQS